MTDTLTLLGQIPDLAAQVATAASTPHRDPNRRSGTSRGTSLGSPMPAAVSCAAMLDSLQLRLAEAVRVAAEEQRDRGAYEPWPPAEPTWSGDCAYLVAAAPWWQPDQFASDWIADAAATIHGALCGWLGERTTDPTWPCPRCGGTLHRDRYLDADDEQLGCADCGHILDAPGVIGRLPASLPDIAITLGVALRTLQRWASVVKPVTTHEPSPRRPALYRPADFARLRDMMRPEDAR